MSTLFSKPKVVVPKAEAPPPVPTIDDAAKARTETDRLRRRRGIGSNLFAGLTAAVPTATQKQLTGQ
jgi:hypothetical protein